MVDLSISVLHQKIIKNIPKRLFPPLYNINFYLVNNILNKIYYNITLPIILVKIN